ncbi:hypothetical protein ED733_001097 [Metarhizium rileyi]|uniref:Alcohol dehydrogenase superfamily, zinc-type n=1 Tax=Metarhizium rileyi (strain RCEF 4871) TaxID=1649241 RepID=A0A5C6GEG2_METRR|nr:hypothetical protein ED733_001097 [Metarhizium rileyi]
MPENSMAGCDFCGIIHEVGAKAASIHPRGTRVCGAVFPYHPKGAQNGAFAQFVAADCRLLLRVPDDWTDLEGASLGGVGWSTLCLAFADPEALALTGTPSRPVDRPGHAVLVYGGGTATGTLACQLLARSGYRPVVLSSNTSAPLAIKRGAVGVASYASSDCVETVRSLAEGPIRHVLDCITDSHSAAICFSAIYRAGGRYACLERFQESWRTRRAVKVKEVMGYEMLNTDVDLGPTVYTRKSSQVMFDIGKQWAKEMQFLLDMGAIESHPIREVDGQWNGIMQAFAMLEEGKARGQRLVVRVSTGIP